MKKIIIAVLIFILLVPAVSTCQDEDFYGKVDGLLAKGETNEAIRFLKKQISRDKTDYIAMVKLGIIYTEKRKTKNALRLFKKALEINPEYPDTYFFLGRLYFLMQKPKEATFELETFRKKMEIHVGTNNSIKDMYLGKLYYIGDVYFNLKEYKLMKSVVDEVLKLNPNDQHGYYNLGVYYYVHERNRSKAYELFTKVIDVDPNSHIAGDARYAIEFMRNNPDPRLLPNFSFIDRLDEEY